MANDPRVQAQHYTVERLGRMIGTDEQLTDMLVEHLLTILPGRNHLEVCGLILIEKPDKAIPVIRRIFSLFPETISDFIDMLLVSPFHIQRQAVPRLIVNTEYRDAKRTLWRCLRDPEVPVVRSAVSVLGEYEDRPFSDEELTEIIADLSSHPSECVQCTVPDIITLIKRPTPFVSEICTSDSWRRRYAIAKNVGRLEHCDRLVVYSYLAQDAEEEIRICLARNMGCVDDWDVLAPRFLRDSSAAVRALAVQMVGDRREFQEILKEVVSDSSWEVRKELLCVQEGETYRNVAIPLINTLDVTPNWRIRMEVLKSISLISRHDEGLLKEFLSKHLLRYLHDNIYEIRIEASRIVEKLIPMYPWTIEWLPEIESAVTSHSYLHRMTTASAAVAFDRAYKTVFTKRLLDDTIDNVKLYTLGTIDAADIDEETREIIRTLLSSSDEEIQRAAASLLDVGDTAPS